MKAKGEVKIGIQHQAFLNSTLDGSKWSDSRPSFSTPGTVMPVTVQHKMIWTQITFSTMCKTDDSLSTAGNRIKMLRF